MSILICYIPNVVAYFMLIAEIISNLYTYSFSTDSVHHYDFWTNFITNQDVWWRPSETYHVLYVLYEESKWETSHIFNIVGYSYYCYYVLYYTYLNKIAV